MRCHQCFSVFYQAKLHQKLEVDVLMWKRTVNSFLFPSFVTGSTENCIFTFCWLHLDAGLKCTQWCLMDFILQVSSFLFHAWGIKFLAVRWFVPSFNTEKSLQYLFNIKILAIQLWNDNCRTFNRWIYMYPWNTRLQQSHLKLCKPSLLALLVSTLKKMSFLISKNGINIFLRTARYTSEYIRGSRILHRLLPFCTASWDVIHWPSPGPIPNIPLFLSMLSHDVKPAAGQ